MKKHAIFVWGLLTTLVIVALLLQTPLLTQARDLAWRSWVATLGSWFSVGPLTVEHNVEEQVTRLTGENARLRAENAELRHLRQQLGALAFEDYRVVPASVAARPLDVFHAHYVLNRGAVDGVVVGAPVVVFGSTLVGFVTELHQATSVVRLLTHPETTTPIEVVLEDRLEQGLLRGRTFTATEVTTVPRDVSLEPGQAVVTAADGQQVPTGLFVGTIEDIMAADHEAYQRASLALPYDTGALRAVAVLVAP